MARQKKRQIAQQLPETKHQAVEDYVNDAVRRLNLAPWVVKVTGELTDEADAMISVGPDGIFADLQLGSDFYERPAVEQRRILAHELGHLIVYPMAEAVRSLETVPDASVYKLFERVFATAEEQSVERMAEVFATRLPLPVFD